MDAVGESAITYDARGLAEPFAEVPNDLGDRRRLGACSTPPI